MLWLYLTLTGKQLGGFNLHGILCFEYQRMVCWPFFCWYFCLWWPTNFPTSQILSWANLGQYPESGGTQSWAGFHCKKTFVYLCLCICICVFVYLCLCWDNILRVVAHNLGLASIAKNQREGAHLMAASLEGADQCISLFRTNNNNNNNILVILQKCRNTQF